MIDLSDIVSINLSEKKHHIFNDIVSINDLDLNDI